jgi:ABC-2 type transport system ATP-binding protein
MAGNGSDSLAQSIDLTRRRFLASMGVAAGVGAGALSTVSNPVAAQEQSDGDFTTERVEIESFDGTTIVATLYDPGVSEPQPAVLMTHGWGGTRQDRDPQASLYASNDYVALAYDSRGFGESGGEVSSTGPNEQRDAAALVSWLAGRDIVMTDGEDDPRIGMDGFSYGGGIQLRLASADDRLDALIPRITWHNLAYSLAPNGVLKEGWQLPLRVSGRQNGTLDSELVEIGQSIAQSGTMNEAEREYYRSRSAASFIGQIDTPALFISGWQDRLFFPNEVFANFRGLRENGVETRLLMHNTGHNFFGPEQSETERELITDTVVGWMDYHLRGEDPPGLSPVTYYDDTLGEFRSAESMPPADASRRTYNLGREGDLDAWYVERPESGGSSRTTVSIDLPVDGRTEVVGVPTLRIEAGAFAANDRARLFAALEDAGPDGSSGPINGQVVPYEVTGHGIVEFDLVGIQHVLEPDHDLRLTVTLADDLLTSVPLGFVPSALYVDSEPGTSAILADPVASGEAATLSVPMRSL